MAGTINNPKKPKSKRGTTRLRHKIQKASASKQRKDRKLAKKNPEWRTKLKKDPGIPNLFPYKEKLLEEIEQKRLKKIEETQKRREMAKAAKTGGDATAERPAAEDGMADEDDDDEQDEDVEGMDDDDDDGGGGDMDESNPMAALIASARAAAEDYDRKLGDDRDRDMDSDGAAEDSDDEEVPVGAQALSRKTYEKVFKQVVERADVVLVMAAASGGKRLILVVNKADLVPPAVLRGWLTHLRRYFPTLPLRAASGASGAHNFHHGGSSMTVQATSTALLRALKSYAASRQLKRAVSVGVIGYPNVGKSSVINALLSRMGGNGKGAGPAKACPAGAEAGVTTSIRAVKMDSKLTLLDSPGVVFPSSSSFPSSTGHSGGSLVSLRNAADAHAHLVLLNALPPKQIDDPIPAVSLLIRRLSAASPELLQKLTDVYDIPALMPSRSDGDVTTDFLVQVARKRGRLGRGGVPNLSAAAMTVVTDWRDGRIQGWVQPPVLAVASSDDKSKSSAAKSSAVDDDAVVPDQKEIVTEWAAEFKLDGLWGDDGDNTDGDAMQE
ncbi:nuclear GTP-binding protein [Geosmithia morbida]|uniref:Nuclear GTP-binding protein n=1 Tax=Geosmithia morbida TaxID=1094350 RepID=A0A9P4YVG1_9HYPO|nr:nuclear GTP-binding protein [Geosmithia morbida]KAF4122529.1 nuclear GTP-binding protein [Geosmithia morbida]